ncbi:GTP-binding protein [Acaryochloris sp. CCMEE 5410]|uniref:GTP-binding protein n=1 Tax=Acaryochloris sp. CCMEE 5410 TaxID=310037 RepID=UPI0002483E62|nr:GTP-binding protein [Acaryochloris sp. CCMEE 5410]KAI9133536.1 GTP-binding protein [Acaryochloris sp. CCMEE 5410]
MNSGFPNPYAFEHSDPETLEAELDQTIQDFEQMQAELGYQQAHSALETLVDKLDLSPRERAGLETEINSLQSMLDKLEKQVVHIAVFGMVSRGKSSLLNALLGQSVFATGPVHGVTQQSQQASWFVDQDSGEEAIRVSLQGVGQSRIELIDTPGIDEVDGEVRERLARQIAQQADLILFVIAGDMTKVEFEALSELRQASKPILLVFNKVDQYPEADRNAIYEKIRDERVRELLSADEIVMASAAPLVAQAIQYPDGRLGAELVPGPPQVQDLKLKILEVLEREGKSLVALNTMLYADDINEQLIERKMRIRDRSANQIIWRGVMAKAVAIALNPVTVVDVLSSAAIDIAMILTLSKLYGISMTQKGAVDLLRKIALTMGGVGATELLTTLGLSSLKGLLSLAAPATGGASLLPYVSVAVSQAAVAGVSSYGIGEVTKRYLINGASWGPNGPKTVVHEILSSLDQATILNRIKSELKDKLESSDDPIAEDD